MNYTNLLKLYPGDKITKVNFFTEFDQIIEQIADPITLEIFHTLDNEVARIAREKWNKIDLLRSKIAGLSSVERVNQFFAIRETVEKEFEPIMNEVSNELAKFKYNICREMYQFVYDLKHPPKHL